MSLILFIGCPVFPGDNFRHGAITEAKTLPDSALGHAHLLHTNNLQRHSLSHLCTEVCQPACRALNKQRAESTLCHRVSDIVKRGAFKEMVWTTAWRVVAAMANIIFGIDNAKSQVIGNAVSSDRSAQESTVPVIVPDWFIGVRPAVSEFWDDKWPIVVKTSPEAFNPGRRILVQHRVTPSLGVVPPVVSSNAGASSRSFYHFEAAA